MTGIRKPKRLAPWLAAVGMAVAAILAYWFYWDRELIEGVRLNPYQADEIMIVRRDGDILQEEIIHIRNKAWIREILGVVGESAYRGEIDPADRGGLFGRPSYIYVFDGQYQKLTAEVYPMPIGDAIESEAGMLVEGRYLYETSYALQDLLKMELSEFMERGKGVEIELDSWRPIVILDGQVLTSYFMGDDWAPNQLMEEVAAVSRSLPDNIRYAEPGDITGLLTEGAGTYDEGTPIYEAEGQYFIRNDKESDLWNMLLPEGEGAHRIDQGREGEVQYWESYSSRRYYVVETAGGLEVFAAQDPTATENCTLVWDEHARLFRSPCSVATYSMDGQPSEPGALPMKRWPSRDWDGVLLYSYAE